MSVFDDRETVVSGPARHLATHADAHVRDETTLLVGREELLDPSLKVLHASLGQG